MAAKGLTIEYFIANPQKAADIVKKTSKRLTASYDYYKPRLDTMLRCYKIYRALKDTTDDDDETNTGPHYAFGIIEDSVAALSESILNSKVPTPARPKHADDEKAAENFNSIAATYFSSGKYQEDYPNSVRERQICGANWEADGWSWKYRKGKRWDKVQAVEKTPDGDVPFTDTREVDQDIPVEVGYKTRFPSIFLMRPQPRKSCVEKMQWVCEIEEDVALSEMEEFQYLDNEGNKKPFFYLDEIKRDKANGLIIRPADVDSGGKTHQDQLHEIVDGVSNKNDDGQDDTDELTLVWTDEGDVLYCVANNKYLVAYVENLYHQPGIKYRVKSCTPQNHSLYGVGMIEPVENLLYELDDIHILSMRNWTRIINKMVAYNPDSVPFAENDFKPRAGGKIRVRPQLGGSVASEIHSLDQIDVTSSMLAQESNDKGLLERALGVPDYSQGVAGTKQDHDTLGGMEKIAAKAAKRMASVRRQELAGFQKQLFVMQGMYSQFMVVKMPFTIYGPNGSTVLSTLDLWDIDTKGRGFNFIIEYDPAMGDDALARNQSMVLMDQAVKYNNAVMTQFPPGTKPLMQLEVIGEKTLKSFGFNDISRVLVRPDGVLTPEAELQMMLQGKPVQVNPLEDLIAHYAAHIQQMQDPKLQEGIAGGGIPADVLLRLQAHIKMTQMAIMQAVQNPQAIIRAKEFAKEGAGLAAPGQDSPTKADPREGVTNFGPRTPQK